MNGPGSYSGSVETAKIQGKKTPEYVSKPVSSYSSYQQMQKAVVPAPSTSTSTQTTKAASSVNAPSDGTLKNVKWDSSKEAQAARLQQQKDWENKINQMAKEQNSANNQQQTQPQQSQQNNYQGGNQSAMSYGTAAVGAATQNTGNVQNQQENTPAVPTTINNNYNIGVDLSINVEGLMDCQVKLEKAAYYIQITWQNIMAQIEKIQQSWVGPDATIYIEKVKKMKPKMEAAINAIKAIYRTYEKAIAEIEANQNSVKSDIQ
jgi:uncharacterized protein YukE